MKSLVLIASLMLSMAANAQAPRLTVQGSLIGWDGKKTIILSQFRTIKKLMLCDDMFSGSGAQGQSVINDLNYIWNKKNRKPQVDNIAVDYDIEQNCVSSTMPIGSLDQLP